MKKVISVILGAVLIAGLSGVALARNAMDSDVRIQVTVSPTVTVLPLSQTVVGPAVQPGHTDAVIQVGFRVDSNSQWLYLSAAASELFKGGVPGSVNKLIKKGKVPVSCPPGSPDYGATPANGGTNELEYGSSTVTINGFTAALTNAIRFESNQNNRFSMPCYLTFTWGTPGAISDAELPQGDYSGYVRFTGTIVPDGQGPVLQ